MQSLRRIHLCNPACREPDTEPDHTGQQQTTASESDKKTPPGVSQSVCVRQIEIEHIEYKHQNHRNRKDQQEKTFHVQKTFQCATGSTKSRTKFSITGRCSSNGMTLDTYRLFTDSRSPIFSRKLSISSIRNPFLMRTRQSIF